uniref:Transposase n=1 Tax=Acrobeloides nanus TaxID=290746 RepID=A0A914DAA9_9BILA
MPRGKVLTEREKGQIDAYRREKKSLHYIARALGRLRDVIRRYMKNPVKYGNIKRKGRKQKLSGRVQRQISRIASNSTKSCVEIKRELGLEVSKSTVRRVLVRNPNLKHQKMNAEPRLLPRHKVARVGFAEKNMARDWKMNAFEVIKSDEKKWNLDGPDGLSGYWRDLRKEPLYFSKRNFGGGSVMVWAGVCYDAKLELQFCSKKVNSAEYTQVLSMSLLPFQRRNRRKKHIFQQDNAGIHTSRETMAWFAANNIEVLEWPSCSPDLNIMENLWGIMVRIVYANNRQFQTVDELKVAIVEAYENIPQETIQKLFDSMPKRIADVLKKNGGMTKY